VGEASYPCHWSFALHLLKPPKRDSHAGEATRWLGSDLAPDGRRIGLHLPLSRSAQLTRPADPILISSHLLSWGHERRFPSGPHTHNVTRRGRNTATQSSIWSGTRFHQLLSISNLKLQIDIQNLPPINDDENRNNSAIDWSEIAGVQCPTSKVGISHYLH